MGLRGRVPRAGREGGGTAAGNVERPAAAAETDGGGAAPRQDADRRARPLAVEARDIRKTFHDGERAVEVLRGVDLEVPTGAFVAVRGPSGSGKSTLLHLLGAMDTPTAGKLAINNVPLSSLSERALTELRSDRIGFVFQFFSLLPTLTAAENVLMPALIAGERPAATEQKVAELLELVGLTDRAGHLPSQLSGGEQQRVALARALLRDPDVLLADEPTGNLDRANATVVLELLRRVADNGQTVVMVTHDAEAASYADDVVSLLDGCRVEVLENDSTETSPEDGDRPRGPAPRAPQRASEASVEERPEQPRPAKAASRWLPRVRSALRRVPLGRRPPGRPR